MSLELDARQRAMLEEIGVRVWQPASPVPSMDDTLPSLPHREESAMPAAAVAVIPRAVPSEIQGLDWDALQQAVTACRACGLCKSRKNTVFGVGDTQARWLVVGEAPGENEDLQGEPFVGQAGRLLDNMLQAVGLSRGARGPQGVYIANVLKCRPPANRNPQPEEVSQCEPYLRRQVALLQPKIILALGRFAAQSLLQAAVPDITTVPLGKLRGQVHQYEGVPVIVSYHPAYLLRTPQDKAKAWADLCLALEVAGAATNA